MSPPGRPKGESASAQREGKPDRPPGRPKGESASAQREGKPDRPPGRPKGESASAQREGKPDRPPGLSKGESASAQREGKPDRAVRSVCVFCGSQSGSRPEYVAAARCLGDLLARRSITVIYGGGHVGMMGELADAALRAGGTVIGVIPQHLMRPEVAHQGLAELVVVDTMHTRKRSMAERADAFAVLPGGYGTLEEMFEMVTWLQLRLHSKPVGIVNVEGFYDPLLQFLRHAADEGFIRPQHWDLLIVESDPSLLLERLRLHRPQVALGAHEDLART
jgi:uncharacterized protein (TIGR00730 family)